MIYLPENAQAEGKAEITTVSSIERTSLNAEDFIELHT